MLGLALLVGGAARLGQAADTASPELVVFAAASLRDVFLDLATTFERRHPG